MFVATVLLMGVGVGVEVGLFQLATKTCKVSTSKDHDVILLQHFFQMYGKLLSVRFPRDL